ncbi:PAS domain-containing protein [Massilia sp. TSP1-1-2]|uniref:sensor histidine kinase n=1 Tax=Massilia sp. TSP1-1-2 TaxID=2804649 RepID=UPI003CEF73B6
MHSNFSNLQERDGAAYAVLESITDAFFALDTEWLFTYINVQAEHVLGFSREQLLGRAIWSVYPGLAGSEFETQYHTAAREKKASTFTAFYPDHRRWYEVHVYPADIGLSVYFRNVSEQIATRQALDEKVARLEEVERRQAFQIALGELVWAIGDPDEIAQAASAMLCEALHADRVMFREAGQIGAAAGVGAIAAPEAFSVPFVQAGQVLAVVELYQAGQRAWTDDDIALARSMAERTWTGMRYARAQARLKAERDQSQHIFQSMTEGFAIMDSDWKFRQMNAVGLRVGQRTESDVMGRTVWEIWPEIIGTEVELRYRKAMATRVPDSSEQLMAFSNGVTLWLEIRLLPVLDGGLAVHYRDISERREADRRKDEFLAMLAHELRNPLAPISAAADLLRLTANDPKRVRQSSDVIARQVRHLTSLVDDLLDVSRVTRGLVLIDRQVLDARRIVEDALEQVQPVIDARRHRLAVQLPFEAACVLGDHKRLVQVLTNLLNNAAKYTPDGGRITLRMEVDAAMVQIIVTDNGIGMSPALSANAFELFAQAERTADRAQGGLGIGLALVRSLVQLHEGSVAAHSQGQGEGSTFTVRLPYVAGPAPGAGTASHLRL